MSDFMSHVAVPVAIGAVAVVLLQFIAIIVIMLTVWIMSK